MEWLGTLPRTLIEQLLPLYRDTAFSYSVAGAMGLLALLAAIAAFVRHSFQIRAVHQRIRAMSDHVTFQSSDEAERKGDAWESAFSDNFQEIDRVMSAPAPFSGGLETAWAQFRRQLVFVPGRPVMSQVQPLSAFSRVGRIGAELEFLSGVFVALGLLATFLGLIAALSFAADGMRSGDTIAMQAAVRDLIAASASKFVTSIAGVGLSILLRFWDRFMESRFSHAMRRMLAGIERATRPYQGASAHVTSTTLVQAD